MVKLRGQAFGYKTDSLNQAERGKVVYHFSVLVLWKCSKHHIWKSRNFPEDSEKTHAKKGQRTVKNSQYHSQKVNIEDSSPEQAQEPCKVLKAIALVDSFKGSQ